MPKSVINRNIVYLPTVLLILATHRPLKRSEFRAEELGLFAAFSHEEGDFLFVYADHSFAEVF